MLQVRENEISLRKWSGGTAQLCTSDGTLVVAAQNLVFICFPDYAASHFVALLPCLLSFSFSHLHAADENQNTLFTHCSSAYIRKSVHSLLHVYNWSVFFELFTYHKVYFLMNAFMTYQST